MRTVTELTQLLFDIKHEVMYSLYNYLSVIQLQWLDHINTSISFGIHIIQVLLKILYTQVHNKPTIETLTEQIQSLYTIVFTETIKSSNCYLIKYRVIVINYFIKMHKLRLLVNKIKEQ